MSTTIIQQCFTPITTGAQQSQNIIDVNFFVVKERVQEKKKTDPYRTYRNKVYASRPINRRIDP